MPPKNEKAEKAANAITIDDVTAVAAGSVAGFLTNVSKGVRRPQAEGGKGTRRRVELYISTDIAANSSTPSIKTDIKLGIVPSPVPVLTDLTNFEEVDWEDTTLADNGGDWEDFDMEIDLGTGNTDTAGDSSDNLKTDSVLKADDISTLATPAVGFRSAPKIEQPSANDSAPAHAPMILGISTRDPAYDQMIADHQAAVAQARSMRLTALRQTINQLTARILSGTLLSRSADSEPLYKALSNVTAIKDILGVFRTSLDEVENAPKQAKTHAPSWITPEKDGSGSIFGKAIHAFIVSLGSGPFSFDTRHWEGVHLDQRHSPSLANELLQRIQQPAVGEARGSLGQKRERDDPFNLKLNHPADYVVLVLCLLRAAGISARLAMASESPSAPATVVNVETDNADEDAINTQVSDPSLTFKKSLESEKVCSYYWIEAWDPMRQVIVSVNPIVALTTRFGAPYTFAFISNYATQLTPEVVLDVSVRYTAKYSLIYWRRLDKWAKAYKHLLWPDTFGNAKDYLADRNYGPLKHLVGKVQDLLNGAYSYNKSLGSTNNDDASLAALVALLGDKDKAAEEMVFGAAVSSSEVDETENISTPHTTVVSPNSKGFPPRKSFESDCSRENIQLEKLLYAEPVPTTLADVKMHPLYVMEKDLQRHEAVYPKDKTSMMGTIRGAFVYKRTAVVALRSRDGWLREGRSLATDDTQPYRVVPPPPSRPLAPASKFYGYWQTMPFVPAPLTAAGHIPRHGNTNWYMSLGAAPPATVTHIIKPQAASVARRVAIEFRQAITGFDKKEWTGPSGAFGNKGKGGGGYEARSEGIVIRTADLSKFETAHAEYLALIEEQEAKRRSQRARNWWNAFAQRLLANDRVQMLFKQGNAY